MSIIQIQFQMSSKPKGIGWWQSLCLYVADHIPIQPRQRTKAAQVIAYLYYLLDYIILWVIIQQNYSTAAVIGFDWPFVIARGVFAALFLGWRKPIFFMFGKMALLMQLILSSPSFLFLDVLAGVADIAMSGIWALTKQQRMLHFDSRFEIFGAFLKQLVFYCSVTVQLLLTNSSHQYEGQTILLGGLVVLLLVDFSEMYYNRLTKVMLLRLDGILILLSLATIYSDPLGLGYLQFIFTSLFLFAVAGLHLVFAPIQRGTLLRLNSQELGNLPQEMMMETLIELKRTAQSGDAEAVQTYLYKLREEAQDAQLVEKIAECGDKDGASRQELLSSFIFQTLKRGAKSSKRVRDLVIYLYSPSPRLYCFLDLNDWQHLREYKRIIAQQLNDSTLREAEAEKELQEVKLLIQRYTRVSNILLQELMKERIRERKVEKYGEELIELLQQLQQISSADKTNSPEVRDLINRFAVQCLPAKYHPSIVRINQQGDVLREDLGELVLGGEEDNLFVVLQANNCFTKLTYLRKERYINKKLAEVLPKCFVAHLTKHIKQVGRQQEEQPELQLGFLFNNLGFAVVCKWKVEPTTHRSGRAWKLTIRQQINEKAVLVASEDGALEGYSELSRYFGITSTECGKKIQGQAVTELRANSLHYLSMGESLFEEHEFYMPKSCILTVLDEPILDGHRFWLLQLKETDMKLKSLANPLIKSSAHEPPEFQFNFDWTGNRITTEAVVQNIRVRQSFVEQERKAINYGENITQMRYFQQKIDYKSNFEQERDCPSLQPHLQRALSSLSINEFYQKWDRKRNSAPLWFKITAALIILIVIIGLSSAVFYLTIFNAAVTSSGTSLQVSTKLQEKLQSVILLGELTTLPFYDPSANATQAISAQITLTNGLSSQLYALDQNIFNNNGGQGILDLLNTLNLHINSYLLTPNYPYRNALTLLTTQIVPNFNKFIQSVISSYSNNSSASSRMAALICLSVLCFGLFMILWLIDFRQSMRRREVAEILKFIDNDDLEAMRERTVRFKQIWLDNVDSKEVDEEVEDEKENPSPPKHLLNSFRLRKRKFFDALWLSGFVVLLVFINEQSTIFWEIANNYISFESNLATQMTALQTVWAELNQATPNTTLLKFIIANAEDNQYTKNVMLKYMVGKGQVGKDFIFYNADLWEEEEPCKYFSDPNCTTFIGGAMAEGANMLICYLNIQHDSYLQNNMVNFSLYSQATQPDVAIISLFYLPALTRVSNQFILSQFASMSSAYQLSTQYYFIGIVMHSLLALVLFRWAIKERKTNNRIEELLMIMPFEKLKNFSAFHKYYLKYYATY